MRNFLVVVGCTLKECVPSTFDGGIIHNTIENTKITTLNISIGDNEKANADTFKHYIEIEYDKKMLDWDVKKQMPYYCQEYINAKNQYYLYKNLKESFVISWSLIEE